MMTLFNCIDDYINVTIKAIVTKGFLLKENEFPAIIPLNIKKYQDEIDRIFNRIIEYLNPPTEKSKSVPDLAQTDEIIFVINEQIPMILKWMSRVFEKRSEKDNSLIFDDDDRKNMHTACSVLKNSIVRLRTIISGIGGNYDLPIEFELPY